jgi:hypothetical protein
MIRPGLSGIDHCPKNPDAGWAKRSGPINAQRQMGALRLAQAYPAEIRSMNNHV